MRRITATPPPLLVVHSKEYGDTKTTVARFSERLALTGQEGSDRLARMSHLVEQGIRALEHDDLETLGQVMDENHTHLSWFGVSTKTLDGIVKLAREAGALGAKLTGGGGGGCAVILTKPGDTAIGRKLEDGGFEVMDI
jgi:mevalonate kinase